jgi:hypothetical protein
MLSEVSHLLEMLVLLSHATHHKMEHTPSGKQSRKQMCNPDVKYHSQARYLEI